jgi:hypothetical protein
MTILSIVYLIFLNNLRKLTSQILYVLVECQKDTYYTTRTRTKE